MAPEGGWAAALGDKRGLRAAACQPPRSEKGHPDLGPVAVAKNEGYWQAPKPSAVHTATTCGVVAPERDPLTMADPWSRNAPDRHSVTSVDVRSRNAVAEREPLASADSWSLNAPDRHPSTSADIRSGNAAPERDPMTSADPWSRNAPPTWEAQRVPQHTAKHAGDKWDSWSYDPQRDVSASSPANRVVSETAPKLSMAAHKNVFSAIHSAAQKNGTLQPQAPQPPQRTQRPQAPQPHQPPQPLQQQHQHIDLDHSALMAQAEKLRIFLVRDADQFDQRRTLLRRLGKQGETIQGVVLNSVLVENAISMAEQHGITAAPAAANAEAQRAMENGHAATNGAVRQNGASASWDSDAAWHSSGGWGTSDSNNQASWWESPKQWSANGDANGAANGGSYANGHSSHGVVGKNANGTIIDLTEDDSPGHKGNNGKDIIRNSGLTVEAQAVAVPDSDDDLDEAALTPAREEAQAAPEKEWTAEQEAMIERLVGFLRGHGEVEKASKTIRSSQSNVPRDIADVAVARYSLERAASLLGGKFQ